MNKPKHLSRGDKVAIVSMSSGILGEKFVKHELDLGVQRLEELGLIPVFMDNTLKGLDFLSQHPEARAADLKQAFADTEIKAVICAIGGEDTFRTLPYLLSDEEFIRNVNAHPKIFMGFSDTTTNHLMFQKLGLNTFYGPALLTDFAEFEPEMLPYTKTAINYLFKTCDTHEIISSDTWYKDRKDFSPAAVGSLREAVFENKGYELLQGKNNATGKLLGGCLDVLAYLAGIIDTDHKHYSELTKINTEYPVFPTLSEWTDKIMFIETSEVAMLPANFEKIIKKFKELKIFEVVAGVIVGKPIDEIFYEDYKTILKQELAEYNIPVLYNLNFGHSYPRNIIPYGATATINAQNKTLTIADTTLS